MDLWYFKGFELHSRLRKGWDFMKAIAHYRNPNELLVFLIVNQFTF